jgi:molybdopterin synthase catalytic subunit
MDISKEIAKLKENPEFAENVGMILVHNGIVRAWSRQTKENVEYLEVHPDYDKIDAIREEFLQREGIHEIVIEALEGRFQPGDDLLFLIVAGDLRENVKPVLADLLDRVKAEAVHKKEIITA